LNSKGREKSSFAKRRDNGKEMLGYEERSIYKTSLGDIL
jgi:hypothetical protein